MKGFILFLILSILISIGSFLNLQGQSPIEGPLTYIPKAGQMVLDKSNHIPGAISGAIDISPTGAATYSIPVKVFPGSNGMQPNLNIVYNSHAAYGMLGYGWTISELSSITRSNKTPYYDSIYKGIDLDENDGLSLDGIRLIERGNYYSPSNNPYTNITNEGQGYKLLTQDSLVMYFGTTNDSRFFLPNSTLPYSWAINKIIDPNGNYIEYLYHEDQLTGEYLIREIKYTGNASSQPFNSIRFYYGVMLDQNFYYIAGKKLTYSKALKRIEVVSEGEETIEYNFDYTKDHYTKLTKISFANNNETYNPTIVYWDSINYDITVSETDYGSTNDIKIFYGDLNGDGLTDIIKMDSANKQLDVRLMDIEGDWTSKLIALPADYYNYNENELIHYNYEMNKIDIIDWTGNGRDNLVLELFENLSISGEYYDEFTNETTPYYYDVKNHKIFAYELIDDTFIISDSLSIGISQSTKYKFYYADLNNDGIVNRVKVLNGSLISIDRLNVATLPTITGIEYVYFVDFNGNGLPEMLAVNSSGGASLWEYHNSTLVRKNFPASSFSLNGDPKSFMAGDFNGDSKTDYVIFNNYSGWKMFYSNGGDFIDFSSSLPVDVNYSVNPVVTWPCEGRECDRIIEMQYTLDPKILRVGDINNDGRSDLIFARHDSLYIYVKDRGIIKQRTPSSVGFKSFDIIEMKNTGERSLLAGTSLAQGEVYKLIHFQDRLDKTQKVSKIIDGMGNQSKINYGIYKDNRQFGQDFIKPAHPVYLARGPFLIVQSLTTEDNSGITNYISFSYEDGYMHAEGLGFLGFKKYTSDNANAQISTTSNFEFTLESNGKEFFSPSLISQQIKKNNIPISTVSYEYELVGNPVSEKLFSRIPVFSENEDHVRNIITQTRNVFDNNIGRIIKTESISGDWKSAVYHNYALITGNISRLQSIAKVNSVDGDSLLFHTSFEYDSNKQLRLISKTDQGVVTKFNAFDSYGNITSLTAYDNSGDSLTTIILYDAKGRYLVSKTDATGLTISKNIRPSDGRILSETDPAGLVISYEYPFYENKKVIKTILPGQKEHTRTLGWDDAGEGLYFIKEQTDPGGYHITYFNSVGQKLKEVYPGYKNTVLEKSFTYNLDGTMASTQQTDFNPVHYTYSNLGRLENITGPNLNVSYEYNGNAVKTTDNIKNIDKTEIYNEIGALVQVNSTMGNVAYEYNPLGQVTGIHSNENLTTMNFDNRGNQTQLIDPSAGSIEYTYNDFGQLTSQTDAKNQTLSLHYDKGRLINQTGPGMLIDYSYSNAPNKKGLLESVSRNGITESYHYDDLNRLDSMMLEGAGKNFTTIYEYNSDDRIYRVNYPTGLSLQFEYDSPGNLVKIFNTADLSNPVWDGVSKNPKQQWQEIKLGNTLRTLFSYDSNEMLSEIATLKDSQPDTLLWLEFDFNEKGQLDERREGNRQEEFIYDELNRLTSSSVAGLDTMIVSYDNLGNIDETTLAGTFTYDSASIYRVIAVNNTNGQGQSPTLFTYTTYTADNKVAVMDNGTFRNEFIYGPAGNRFKVDHYENNNHLFSKIYVDNNEFVLDNAGNIIISRTFIYTPTGICAVYQDSLGVKEMFYIHTDYLGSWLGISDSTGTMVHKFNYDAWGRPRDPETWDLLPVSIDSVLVNLNAMQPRFDRGYTGHEHMCGFGLINMNGRLYDPYLQRFLSPDPFIISPTNAQDYNRYSYVLNNPLMYTDPSGYSRGRSNSGYSIGSPKEIQQRLPTEEPLPFPVGGAVWQASFGGSQTGSFGNPFLLPGANWINDYGKLTYQQTMNLQYWNSLTQSLLQQESGFSITPIDHFGRTNLVGHFGTLGELIFGEGDGIIFSNPKAGAYLIELDIKLTVSQRNSRPIIHGPIPEIEYESSWQNLLWWGDYIDQSIFKDNMPAPLKNLFEKVFPPTVIIINANTFITGKNEFHSTLPTNFERFIIAPLNIFIPFSGLSLEIKIYLELFPRAFDRPKPRPIN